MPSRGVIRRDRKSHSNLRPKHKHTKHYLKHYWPYLPLVLLVIVGLWTLKPIVFKSNPKVVLAASTSVNSQDLLSATNSERGANKLSNLRLNTQLSAAAQAKAQDMVAKNYWSHNTPDGSPPWVFITDSGYNYQKAGENLAYGFENSHDIITGWMNSPTHRQNVLDGDYLDVGFGIVTSNDFNHSGPTTLIVAMYGRAADEAPTVAVISNSQGSTEQAYNTSQKTDVAESQTVNNIDLITGTRYRWITPMATFLMGACLAVLALKHSLGIRKAIRRGEKFVISHPALDAILVSVILGCLFLTRQVGLVL